MTWFFFAVIVVAGFALLKVRRRRKAQQSDEQLFRFESGLSGPRRRLNGVGDGAREGTPAR